MKEVKKLMQKIDSLDYKELNSGSLLNGRLGLVYYYFSLYKYFKEEKYLLKIQSTLEVVFKNIENQESSLLLNSTFENGLSGLGYVLQLLINEGVLETEYESQIEEINEIVFNDALNLLEQNNYDFVRGPFGMLFYLNFIDSKDYVDTILDVLINKFKEDRDFSFYNEYSYIEGVHIGYAHGLCGIIKVLNEIEDERADYIIETLLYKLVKVIKKNEVYLKGEKYSLPRSIHNTEEFKDGLNYRAVLAWSNSDVNFSTLIYSLKERYVTNELLDLANEIAEGSLNKKEEEHTRIWDHRFYFGSSGVLKTYDFLYKKTKNIKYKEASVFWYKKTLDLLNENVIKEPALNFINNLPATALSILEFEEEKDVNWSKIVLL